MHTILDFIYFNKAKSLVQTDFMDSLLYSSNKSF